MNKKGQLGRVLFAWIIIAFGSAFAVMFCWNTLNQRIFIPIAKWLRFKKDDTERVEKEVKEILGEDDNKKKKR